jgi:hypothetical protein
MVRFSPARPIFLAAALLATGLGAAQAQTSQSTTPMSTGSSLAPMGGGGPAAPVPGMAPAGRMPMAPPMRAGMDTAPATGRDVAPTPAQPFTDLSLPQQQVGNGAYNGGGVVLEYLPDGTRREVR